MDGTRQTLLRSKARLSTGFSKSLRFQLKNTLNSLSFPESRYFSGPSLRVSHKFQTRKYTNTGQNMQNKIYLFYYRIFIPWVSLRSTYFFQISPSFPEFPWVYVQKWSLFQVFPGCDNPGMRVWCVHVVVCCACVVCVPVCACGLLLQWTPVFISNYTTPVVYLASKMVLSSRFAVYCQV